MVTTYNAATPSDRAIEMMLINWLVLFVLDPRSLSLESAPLRLREPVVNRFGILACAGTMLYRWDFEGDLIETVELGKPVKNIIAFHFSEHGYIVAYQSEKGAFSQVFDPEGRPLSPPFPFLRFMREVDGRIMAPLTLGQDDYFWRHNYPFLAIEMQPVPSGGEIVLRKTGLALAKVNDRMLDLDFNFKEIWIVKLEDRFLVVNQLEPRVYFYDQRAIRQERADGEHKATAIDFKLLALPAYEPPPQRFFQLEKTVSAEEGRRRAAAWFRCLGLITWFGRLGDGFAITYRIPRWEQGSCAGNGLGLQVLDEHLGPQGPMIEVEGTMMGAVDHSVFTYKRGEVLEYPIGEE